MNLGISYIITNKVDGFKDYPIDMFYVFLAIFFTIGTFMSLKGVANTNWL